MATTPSVKIVKHFAYRGVTKAFTNRYHFNGGTPADIAHWNTLFDNITSAEKAIYPGTVSIVEAIGYDAGSDVPVAVKTYALAGTFSVPVNSFQAPGDCAALLRYSTTARTSKNHPIYLFNYYHGVCVDEGTGPDAVTFNQLTAYNAYGTAWLAGFSDGVNTYLRAGPNGATATTRVAEGYAHHRDFRN